MVFFRLKNCSQDTIVLQAKAEQLLLETYDVALPDRVASSAVKGMVDHISRTILEKFHPVLLIDMQPLEIEGDGNCFFRALSLALYGNQNSHNMLRLLTAI